MFTENSMSPQQQIGFNNGKQFDNRMNKFATPSNNISVLSNNDEINQSQANNNLIF